MLSFQTNVDSLVAQQDMSVNNAFQSQTIAQLSSGYRINSSADDAAGLAVANQYMSDTVELQQGVRNANDGLSQLQIVDGGLSNISNMLNRMKTLATESATSTFTGNRTTLNNEYQNLISEITRQAENIQLNAGGNLNTTLNVYIGGARTSSVTGTGLVSVNLSGTTNAVDASSLGLNNTNVLGGNTGSVSFTNNNVTNLNDPAARFLSGGSGSETFVVSYVNSSGVVTTQNVTLAATSSGLSGTQITAAINGALVGTGVQSQIGTNGALQFNGGGLLGVTASTSGGPTAAPVQTGATLLNAANYQTTGNFQNFVAGGGGATSESFVVSVNGTNYNVSLDSSTAGNTAADNATDAVNSLNYQLRGSGVYATTDGQGHITLQSARTFSLAETGNTPGAGGTPGTGTLDVARVWNPQWAYLDFLPFTPGSDGGTATTDNMTVTIGGTGYSLTLTSATSGNTAADTLAHAINSLNAQFTALGIDSSIAASDDGFGGISLNSTAPFTIVVDPITYGTSGAGSAGSGFLFGTSTGAISVTAPTLNNGAGSTGNAQAAIQAVNSAVGALGLVQGAVGAGENTLNYAIALAQSQVTNYSAAESQIKDADIAAAASNLTKAQVLQQTSIAAMAQANSKPEAVLKLLR